MAADVNRLKEVVAFPRWLALAVGGAVVVGGALALSLRQDAPALLRLGRWTAVAVAPEPGRISPVTFLTPPT